MDILSFIIRIHLNTPDQMDAILTALEESFDLSACPEITVEIGRPDTITAEKLAVLKSHGVTRVCVNPQTMEDHVLAAIGETPKGDGVELLDQLHSATGVPVPRRLAALKGKERRFHLDCEKAGMDGVVLDFLR